MNSTYDKLVIDVQDLHKKFEDKVAVDSISVSVKKGEIFGFVGPNGGGKTTTLRMITGLLTPDNGSGTCLGFDILKQSAEIKQEVGYMTQKFSLYNDLSVYENLDFIARIYGMKDIKASIKESLKFLGLEKEYQNKLAGELSGGWKQRLALSAAILHKPKLLLLDEPTAGIDPKARRTFWDEIHRLAAEGVTTLVSTQFMDEAERCNRIAYIAKGRVLVHGTISEVIQQSKLTTYALKGDNLEQQAVILRNKTDIEQVTNYGTELHVSDTRKNELVTSLHKFVPESYQYEEIEPTMEDVFIHYSEGLIKESQNE